MWDYLFAAATICAALYIAFRVLVSIGGWLKPAGDCLAPSCNDPDGNDGSDRFDRYFFERHDAATLMNWASRLQLFRYVRAYGGMLEDDDCLECAFVHESADDLERFFAFTGITPVRFAQEPPQPEAGKSYPYDKWASFPDLIEGTKWIQQPGICPIDGHRVHVRCERGVIAISIGNRPDVTEEDVKTAEALEPLLEHLPLRVIDPPRNSRHCLSPRHYPEFFRT